LKKKNEAAAQNTCDTKITQERTSLPSRMTMNSVIKIDAKHHTAPESAAIAAILAKSGSLIAMHCDMKDNNDRTNKIIEVIVN